MVVKLHIAQFLPTCAAFVHYRISHRDLSLPRRIFGLKSRCLWCIGAARFDFAHASQAFQCRIPCFVISHYLVIEFRSAILLSTNFTFVTRGVSCCAPLLRTMHRAQAIETQVKVWPSYLQSPLPAIAVWIEITLPLAQARRTLPCSSTSIDAMFAHPQFSTSSGCI